MVVLCHANVRSLVAEGRKKEIEELAHHNRIDILCLTETWLKPKHLDSSLMIPGFQKPFRLDRLNSRGGGVAVYVRDGHAVGKLSLPSVDIECIGLRVTLPKRKKGMLFTVYRPPQTVTEPFLHDLELVLYPYLKHTLWLVGDFNAKNSAWWSNQSTGSQGEALKFCADSLNLHQIITQPTYIVLSGTESLLDLMFMNAPHSVHHTRCRRLRIIVQSSHTCQQRKVARPSRKDVRSLCMTRQMPDNINYGMRWKQLIGTQSCTEAGRRLSWAGMTAFWQPATRMTHTN